MVTFDLGGACIATCTIHRAPYGYIAKGTVFLKDRATETFEGHASAISAAEQAAWLKALEIQRRLSPGICKRAKTGPKIKWK